MSVVCVLPVSQSVDFFFNSYLVIDFLLNGLLDAVEVAVGFHGSLDAVTHSLVIGKSFVVISISFSNSI